MHSRYDYMWESNSRDEKDNEFYPDPLSVNYDAALEATNKMPDGFELTKADLKKFWVAYYKATGKTEEDDILLQLNDVPHIGMLEPGDVLYKFNPKLIKSYTFFNLRDN